MFTNGILFNHESPVRGQTFVTRKITKANTKLGWTPKYNLKALVEEMIQSDLKLMQKIAISKKGVIIL